MTLKGLLRLTLVGLVLALVLAAIFGPLSLNLPLFLATFGLLMALLCLSFVNYRKAEPLAIFTLYLCVIWLAFRAVYLNFRFESLNYQYLIISNQQTVATSYILITAFSLILFMGIWVGSLIRLDGSRKVRRIFDLRKNNDNFLLKYSWILVAVYASKFLIPETVVSNIPTLIWMLTSTDPFIILVISGAVYRFSEGKSNLDRQFIYLLAAFLLLRTLDGSKGALFVVAYTVLACFLIQMPKFRVQSKTIFLSLLLFIISVALFFVGHGFRLLRQHRGNIDGAFESWNGFLRIFDVFDSMNYFHLLDMLSQRLSMLDYLNVMFTQPPYFGFLGGGYATIMAVNTLIPSTLSSILGIGEYTLFPANLFKVAYGFGSYQAAELNYHTDMLPLWGLIYVNMPMMSFLFTFLTGFFGSLLFKFVNSSMPDQNSVVSAFFVIYFGDFLFGMGPVSLFQHVLFFILMPLLFYRFWRIIFLQFSKMKKQKKIAINK